MPEKQHCSSRLILHYLLSCKVARQVVVTAALAVVLLGVGFGSKVVNVHAASTSRTATHAVNSTHHFHTLQHSHVVAAIRGFVDAFPYGQCTYWASARYHQLHGIYVPWMVNADAYEWVARAHEFHWRVSRKPRVGAIIVLAPWTQGASSVGHVGVVERVSGHRVLVSSMNWNGSGSNVAYWTFSTGAGVSFVTSY
jgi:surface antigen